MWHEGWSASTGEPSPVRHKHKHHSSALQAIAVGLKRSCLTENTQRAAICRIGYQQAKTGTADSSAGCRASLPARESRLKPRYVRKHCMMALVQVSATKRHTCAGESWKLPPLLLQECIGNGLKRLLLPFGIQLVAIRWRISSVSDAACVLTSASHQI